MSSYILILHRENGSAVRWCVCLCVFALLLHPAHISFIGCVALVLEGPGRPQGQQVWPLCAPVVEGIKAQTAQEWSACWEPSEQLQKGRWGYHCLEPCSCPIHYSQAGCVCEQSHLIFLFCLLFFPPLIGPSGVLRSSSSRGLTHPVAWADN